MTAAAEILRRTRVHTRLKAGHHFPFGLQSGHVRRTSSS